MKELVRQLCASGRAAGWPAPDKRHRLYIGASGMGKTGAMLLDIRATIDAGRGAHIVDIEGELTPQVVEYVAARAPWRTVHVLDARSPASVFGLPLIDVPTSDPDVCSSASLRALAVMSQVVNFGADDFGPRLKKCLYMGLFALARTGRPMVALPELFGSHDAVRAALHEALPFPFMRDALQSLNDLPPRQLVDYTDALISRMMPLFSSPSFRRVFGQAHGRNLDVARIVRDGDIVLMPLGKLEHQAAVLIGSAYYSILFHQLVHEAPTPAARIDIYIDEAANFLTPDLAHGFDRLRKRGAFLRVACQRLAQFHRPDDPAATVLSAILTGCRSKIVFGGLAPDDAELMARVVFTGHLDLDTVYKQRSIRPVVVGQIRTTLTSRTQARHHVTQSAHAVTDAQSSSYMDADGYASSSAWSDATSIADGMSHASLPDGSWISPPTPVGNTASQNRARTRSFGTTSSRTRVTAEQSGDSHAESYSSGSADGVSRAEATHDAYISQFADLPTESYSLEEKLHAATGLLSNLEPREALIKSDGDPPLLIERTPELVQPFRSASYRVMALTAFANKIARSRYLRSVAEVDAEIAAALADLARPASDDPDFTQPEPTRLRGIGRPRGG